MNSCSEYVSSGHSDKTADLIASYLLDEYIKHDPKTRFALEVQLKDHICNLAGEVTSTWQPETSELAYHVREAIRKVGYTAEYASKWPEGATLNADKVIVNDFIGQQSPDIAQGVDNDGWGDMGVFAGLATWENTIDYMPRDRYFAHEIGKMLYNEALKADSKIGLDIKVSVAINNTEKGVERVIVAAPMLPENEKEAKELIEHLVRNTLIGWGLICEELIINGTGTYVIHSSVGDAGVVGRKLAVDFYGLNCPIGGGSPWGKCATKADVTLNIAARYFALKKMLEIQDAVDNKSSEFFISVPNRVITKINCCIGKSKCLVSYGESANNANIYRESVDLKPSELIHKFGLDGSVRDDMFFHLCKDGLFTEVDKIAIEESKA